MGTCFHIKASLALSLCLIAGVAYAGAWTQKSGNSLLINNFSYYSTSQFFDNSGKKQSLPTYKKYEFNPYIEYGLRDYLTVGANIFLPFASQYNTNKLAIGDSEFFARARIWQKNGFVFSAEPMIKFPSIENHSTTPQIGSRNFDAGLTFSGGYSFKSWQLDHFVNLDAGYRHRYGAANDQLKFTTSAGFSISKKHLLLVQIFNTTRTKSNNNPAFTQSSNDDYDLTKLQISTIYKMNEKISLQIGAFSNIAGRNIGNGNGAIFSISKIF